MAVRRPELETDIFLQWSNGETTRCIDVCISNSIIAHLFRMSIARTDLSVSRFLENFFQVEVELLLPLDWQDINLKTL